MARPAPWQKPDNRDPKEAKPQDREPFSPAEESSTGSASGNRAKPLADRPQPAMGGKPGAEGGSGGKARPDIDVRPVAEGRPAGEAGLNAEAKRVSETKPGVETKPGAEIRPGAEAKPVNARPIVRATQPDAGEPWRPEEAARPPYADNDDAPEEPIAGAASESAAPRRARRARPEANSEYGIGYIVYLVALALFTAALSAAVVLVFF